MMLRARCLLFPLLSFSIVLPSSLSAQQPAPRPKPSAGIPARNLAIHFDPQATQIRFKVGSLVRDVRGTFQLKGGALAVDPDSTLAQGELLVDATTGRTGNAARDKQMQEEVLESKRYPSIFFHAEHLRGQVPKANGSSDVIAEGMLNVHGADHRDAVEGAFGSRGQHPQRHDSLQCSLCGVGNEEPARRLPAPEQDSASGRERKRDHPHRCHDQQRRTVQ